MCILHLFILVRGSDNTKYGILQHLRISTVASPLFHTTAIIIKTEDIFVGASFPFWNEISSFAGRFKVTHKLREQSITHAISVMLVLFTLISPSLILVSAKSMRKKNLYININQGPRLYQNMFLQNKVFLRCWKYLHGCKNFGGYELECYFIFLLLSIPKRYNFVRGTHTVENG